MLEFQIHLIPALPHRIGLTLGFWISPNLTWWQTCAQSAHKTGAGNVASTGTLVPLETETVDFADAKGISLEDQVLFGTLDRNIDQSKSEKVANLQMFKDQSAQIHRKQDRDLNINVEHLAPSLAWLR